MRIPRETLDNALALGRDLPGAAGALDAVRSTIRSGERVFVDEYDGSESLLTLDSDGRFTSTPIAVV